MLIGIITGIISSVIILICKWLYTNYIYYTQSKYSGKWEDEIYNEEGEIIKRDEYILKHHKKNNTITGTIKRITPLTQKHRTWNCSGALSGEHLILSFWSNDVIKSDGCIYAKLIDDFTYEGYYLKIQNSDIVKVRIRMKKVRGM